MNNCLNCGGETNNKKFCSISCQNKFQNPGRSDKKFGVFKSFIVKCHKCGKNFEVIERENLFPKKKIYYCGRGCANSRIHSQETKDNIRKSLQKNNVVKITCKQCDKEFEVTYGERKRMFCSRSCASKWINMIIKLNKGTKPHFRVKKPKDLNKKTFIYTLEYPTGNIKYVGKSDNPNKRLRKHIKEAKYRNKNHRDKWINSLSESPLLNVIEETTYEHWQDREIYWINFYKEKGFILVNGTDGGEGSNGFKGRTHSQKTKDKLSKLAMGRIPSKETIDKLSGENSGRCKIKDDEVMEIFRLYYEQKISYQEIARQYNINKKYIYQLVTGKERKNIFNKYKLSR